MRHWRGTSPARRLAFGVLVAAVVGGSTVGCDAGGDSPVSPEETVVDQETAGPVFDEKRITAALSGTEAHLTVKLGNPGDVSIPGTMTVTLRDLDGNALSTADQAFDIPAGGQELTLALGGLEADIEKAATIKYVFDYDVRWDGGESKGRRSLYDAIKKLQVILLTEDELEVQRGGHFTLFVLDPATGKPVQNAVVQVGLQMASGANQPLAEVKTDEAGSASGEIELGGDEALESGSLLVTVTGNGAVETADVSIKIVRDQKILLTTDKPLYQPGQRIFLRALALHAGDKKPEADQPLVFEVEDAKGNKLAKELVMTDAFGVAATDIQLANQINMGKWTVRAILGSTISEKTLTVERYTLPKFKTELGLDQGWYAPGDTVKLHGEARYFFGKPVAGASVHIVASTFDVDFTPFADLTLTANEEGLFATDLQVPSYVVGMPLEQGKGALKIDVTVTDTAGQEFTATAAAPIAEGGIQVSLVPESGTLAAGIENKVYVVTSDPLGNPLAADVSIGQGGTELVALKTGETGLGSFMLTPAETETLLEVSAKSGEDEVSVTRTLSVEADSATVLLRTSQAVYAVGDTVQIDVLVGEAKDRVFLDLVHGGRTVDMRALDVVDGQAAYAFDLDTGMTGELLASVFYVTDQGTMVRDQKLLFVQGASELNVMMTAQKEIYQPGDPASIDIKITGEDGQGVVAAVGVQIVDEAVFALMEVQPGLLKIFFDLAQELAQPRVWLKPAEFSAQSVVQDADVLAGAGGGELQDRANVAFAALEDLPLHSVQMDTYKATVAAMQAALKPFVDAERDRMLTELQDLASIGVLTWENVGDFLASELDGQVDFWNRPYVVTVDTDAQTATVTGSGPDERADTLDDIRFDLSFSEVIYGNRAWGVGEEMDADFDGAGGGPPNAGGAVPEAPTDGGTKSGGSGGIKVRQFFPETLYNNPAVITDESGKATIDLHVADSITEWRMTGLASSQDGRLGSGQGGIIVFQDFFVDIDFPVAITRGDAFSVPVALYNYLDEPQVVNLEVEPAPWVEVTGASSKTITLQPGQVTGVSFDIAATQVGVHGLTILANGTSMSDAVKRTVRVEPDGKAFQMTKSSRFPSSEVAGEKASVTVAEVFNVPSGNIDGSQSLTLKVYPGFLSQVVEGMDSMLRLPGG